MTRISEFILWTRSIRLVFKQKEEGALSILDLAVKDLNDLDIDCEYRFLRPTRNAYFMQYYCLLPSSNRLQYNSRLSQ